MRVVVTSDTHFPFPKEFIPEGDVFIHCGDLMYSGYVDEWSSRVASLAALEHKVKILVPGNHDLHIALYPGPALVELRKAGVTVCGAGLGVKESVELPNGYTVLGLPWVTGLPRWAWNRTEGEIERQMEHLGRHKIVASHSPPSGILDGKHYGVREYRRYLKKFQPEYWFCGHVHEGYGEATVDGCHIFNVAAQNETYTGLVNPPVVIDL